MNQQRSAALIRYHLLKYLIIGHIPGRAVDSKFDGAEGKTAFLCHDLHGSRNNFGRVFEGAAAVSAKNHDFVSVDHCDIQDLPQLLGMELIQFLIADRNIVIPVCPQIGRCTGDHAELSPVVPGQEPGLSCIRLEHHNAWDVNAVVVVMRILFSPVCPIERFSDQLCGEARIQCRNAAQSLLLGKGAPEHTAAGILRRSEIQNTYLLTAVSLRGFKAASGGD